MPMKARIFTPGPPARAGFHEVSVAGSGEGSVLDHTVDRGRASVDVGARAAARTSVLERPMPVKSFFSVAALAAVTGLAPTSALAQVVFSESFGTDTLTTADTLATYPGLTFDHSDPGMIVQGGVLRTPLRSFPNGTYGFIPGALSGAVEFSIDIGASDPGGLFPVGIELMGTRIVFHPGFTGGAFRAEDLAGNVVQAGDLGFTPAVGALHHLTLRTDGVDFWELELIDGNAPSNVFNTSFTRAVTDTNASFWTGNRAGLFDNILVSRIPAPGSVSLLAIGGVIAGRRRR